VRAPLDPHTPLITNNDDSNLDDRNIIFAKEK